MITRDPLSVPCITDRYWATFADLPARELARTLALVRAHPPREPLPEDQPAIAFGTASDRGREHPPMPRLRTANGSALSATNGAECSSIAVVARASDREPSE